MSAALGLLMKFIRIAAVAVALALTGAGSYGARVEDAPSAETMQAAKDLVALITQDTMKELAARVTAQV